MSRDFGILEIDVVNEDSGTSRFLSSDVGFFNLFYNGKLSDIKVEIKHAEKKTYFRDVFIFINRIKDIARVKGVELLRNNLQICLRNKALK